MSIRCQAAETSTLRGIGPARLQQLARATAGAASTYRDGFGLLRAFVKPAVGLTALLIAAFVRADRHV
jgi:hypothetical protein